jgi:hypothetical protein
MSWKLTRTGSAQRIQNAFGRLRRRGGAGAVAAGIALTLAFALVATSFAATACRPSVPVDVFDEPREDTYDDGDIIPWEKPAAEPAHAPHGASPARLPC